MRNSQRHIFAMQALQRHVRAVRRDHPRHQPCVGRTWSPFVLRRLAGFSVPVREQQLLPVQTAVKTNLQSQSAQLSLPLSRPKVSPPPLRRSAQ